jgi:hypothetical protein
MKVKEQTIEELNHLRPTEMLEVYNLILSLKNSKNNIPSKKSETAYLKVREALKHCQGSLAEDILLQRKERI